MLPPHSHTLANLAERQARYVLVSTPRPIHPLLRTAHRHHLEYSHSDRQALPRDDRGRPHHP